MTYPILYINYVSVLFSIYKHLYTPEYTIDLKQ